MRAYEIEDDFGTMEAAEGLLRQAVQACSASERLWLMLIQLKYLKEKDSEGGGGGHGGEQTEPGIH